MKRVILCTALLLLLPRAHASSPDGRALVAIERPASGAPDTAARLLDAGVCVLRDLEGYLVALAGPADIATLERLALGYRVLDPNPGGKTFYVASAHAPGAYAAPEKTRARATRVCMESPWGDVIEATPESADELAASGVHVARLFMTPMRAALIDKPAPRAAPAVADPLIQAMADSVSGVTIDATVQRLQDFVNRYSLGDSVDSARDWIAARFVSFGIDSVAFQEFDTLYGENVVAVIPGVGHPEKQVVIGGHYDSTAPGVTVAPGADDNATGTTCVLECARILSQYPFDYTLVFVAFCGEEQGLIGSEAYAAAAAADGDEIVAMVNVDMIGYLQPGDPLDTEIVDNASSTWLRDLAMAIAPLYAPALPAIDGALPGGANSDHASFWRHGFDAIMFWEDTNHWSPYIHTVNDLVGLSYNAPQLALGSIKIAVALMATLAEPFRVIIQHTPVASAEDTQSAIRIDANILTTGPLDADSLLVHYTTIDGEVVGAVRAASVSPSMRVAATGTAPLVYLGHDDAYQALIPPQPAGTIVDYYLVAKRVDGYRAIDPKGAPATQHRFIVGTPVTVFADDFDTDMGWTVGAIDDDALDGLWVREAPNETRVGATVIQPGSDHTPDPGSVCYVTGNAPEGVLLQGFKDVDYGKTTLLSPVLDLSSHANVWFRYYRWYTNNSEGAVDDEWKVDVSGDGGQSWVNVETLATTDRTWRLVERNLSDFVPPTAAVRFRFIAEDADDSSIVEGLVDDFAVISYTGQVTAARDTPPRASLAQNYPNPFNPTTTIRIAVPGERASLRVYDVAGRLVATLLDHEVVTGERLVFWDGRNRDGVPVASGVYFYRLDTPTTTLARKLVVVR